MGWTNSKIFTTFETDLHNRVTNGPKINTDTIEVALFDNTITPDQTVTSANSAYAAGVWAGGHVLDAAGWPSLGRPLASISSVFASNVYTFSAANTVSANSSTTLTNAYGCLVYDHTSTAVTDQGISFNYFGGANSVTAGTFTVVWNVSGILALTL